MENSGLTPRQKAQEIWNEQLKDLCDRGGIKHGFRDIEPHIWDEINSVHIGLIEQALQEAAKVEWPRELFLITTHEAMGETWFNVRPLNFPETTYGTFNNKDHAELFAKALGDRTRMSKEG